ncbi:MAG TPA: ABC transporter substrate-binding protein [Gammaproteobacteria bacterium]|nr:ABC transporter substrate-binding protein [Gammaproteobacteria bacterium]
MLIATMVLAAVTPSVAQRLPSVASINLCADQLVLSLAESGQILTVSWLAADPEESMLAGEAAKFPLNYGSAEELLRYQPDVVIAGAYTGSFTRALLARLGFTVVEIAPETTIAEIEDNVRLVARAIGQPARGEALVDDIRARTRHAYAHQPRRPIAAVVVRPGGFTVGAGSLAHELMTLAGLRNVAAEQGLDRWGSLSMETLLRSAPELIIVTGYHSRHASLANVVLQHPALTRLRSQVRSVTVPAPYWACGLPQSLHSAALLQGVATPR